MTNAGFNMGNWLIDLGSPLVVAMTVLLLVSLLLTWRAVWQRLYATHPSRAVIVMALNLVAFVTVFLLLSEPQRKHLVSRDVLLFTEGAKTETKNQFDGKSVYVSPGTETTPEALQNLKNANWLLDVAQLPLREPALANIEIRGFGLKQSQWQSMPADINIAFQTPPLDGFSEMHWPRTLVAGEPLFIGGHFSNQVDDAVLELRLLDPADNMIDEVRARNGGYFNLSARPKGRGNLVYTLQAWSGDRLLAEQAVTTSVGTAGMVRIMVEQSAPSFETRQLKNYAAGNGAQVLINTRISRGKSISQSVNLPDGAEIKFSPQSLAQQDVLIMDGRAVISLTDRQRQWLSDAVANGLGLLVLADASLADGLKEINNELFADFKLSANPDAQAEPVPRLISHSDSGWQQPLQVAAMQLEATDADILIDDGQGNALVVNKSTGLGHVAISLITQSHRWLTNGNRDYWSDYWASLIASISRPRSDSYLVPQSDETFLRVGERASVCALSRAENLIVTIIPTGAADQQAVLHIPLTADKLGSARQCGWFWPQYHGWLQVQLRTESDGPVLDQQGLFIFEKHQWLAQSRHERVTATHNRNSSNNNQQDKPNLEKWVSEPLDVIWLYVLLLISASLLWIERKQFH